MVYLVYEEYEDKLHQNFDYKGDKVMIGNCVQVSNQCV